MANRKGKAQQDEHRSSGGSAKQRQSKAKKGGRARHIESNDVQAKNSSKTAVPKVAKHEVDAKNVRGEGLH